MIAGIHGKEKVRLKIICADPRSSEAYPSCQPSNVEATVVFVLVTEDIHECLALRCLPGRMPFLIRLHIELDFVRTAPRSHTSRRRRVLSKDRRCQKEDNEHHFEHRHRP